MLRTRMVLLEHGALADTHRDMQGLSASYVYGIRQPCMSYVARHSGLARLGPNNRIVAVINDQATFRSRGGVMGQLQTCTLPAEGFIRRSLHQLVPELLLTNLFPLTSPLHI